MQSVLMLPVVHHAVFGAYTCIAENIHGKLEKVVMLTEGAKPGTPHINPLKIYPDGLALYIEVSYLWGHRVKFVICKVDSKTNAS